MSLDSKIVIIHNNLYTFVHSIFIKIAKLFGYPSNPGLQVKQELANEEVLKEQFIENLPQHSLGWPQPTFPKNWCEMIFGAIPKPDVIHRYIYETKKAGFYNFYIYNYKDICFLPDWLSEFIQIKLNICLNHTLLDEFRESFMVIIFVFYILLSLRLTLTWFLSINPFNFPWRYIVALIDWSEELFQGAIPFILGINIFASFFLVIAGSAADDLNNLVLTMPFLPSEKEQIKLITRNEIRDVLIFRFLPILWYKHKIPNEIREFWYRERPDILNYMQKTYGKFNIPILPERILQIS